MVQGRDLDSDQLIVVVQGRLRFGSAVVVQGIQDDSTKKLIVVVQGKDLDSDQSSDCCGTGERLRFGSAKLLYTGFRS